LRILYGHGARDLLLQRVDTAIRETIRKGDTPARMGGDEFALLFWRIHREAAITITRRLIERIRVTGAVYPVASVEASVGIVWLARPPENSDTILARADAVMYEAKLRGKGRVVFHSDDERNVGVMEAGASC
jgi:diguanylate cyclase (GGDEF)-like protein